VLTVTRSAVRGALMWSLGVSLFYMFLAWRWRFFGSLGSFWLAAAVLAALSGILAVVRQPWGRFAIAACLFLSLAGCAYIVFLGFIGLGGIAIAMLIYLSPLILFVFRNLELAVRNVPGENWLRIS
jgi:hypothetical protein